MLITQTLMTKLLPTQALMTQNAKCKLLEGLKTHSFPSLLFLLFWCDTVIANYQTTTTINFVSFFHPIRASAYFMGVLCCLVCIYLHLFCFSGILLCCFRSSTGIFSDTVFYSNLGTSKWSCSQTGGTGFSACLQSFNRCVFCIYSDLGTSRRSCSQTGTTGFSACLLSCGAENCWRLHLVSSKPQVVFLETLWLDSATCASLLLLISETCIHSHSFLSLVS